MSALGGKEVMWNSGLYAGICFLVPSENIQSKHKKYSRQVCTCTRYTWGKLKDGNKQNTKMEMIKVIDNGNCY